MEPSGFAAAAGAAAHVLVDASDVPDLDDVLDVLAALAGPHGVEIGGDAGHHLQRVRRLAVGETVTVSPGDGRWRPARVTDVVPGRLRVEAVGPVTCEPELAPGLDVAFCPGRRHAPEPVVAQLTELGVDRIVPVVAERSSGAWASPPARAVARLRRAAREACGQSRRARLPVVADPTPVALLAGHPAAVLGAPGGGPPPDGPPAGRWLVVTGPEGGFTREEQEMLGPAAVVGIGPHVLRVVTAPVALAAVLSVGRTPRTAYIGNLTC